MQLFGFTFVRKQQADQAPASFVPRETDDGALTITAGGSFGTYVDLDGTVRTEAELITRYREMSLQPEIDSATDEIVNEMIDISEDKIVAIELDHIDNLSDPIKKAITAEFEVILGLLDFNRKAYELMRRWYIDGRLYYHAIIDDKKPKEGIKEVRYIDPRKLRKIREIEKRRVPGQPMADLAIPVTKNEYYIYNDKGFSYGNKSVGGTTTGIKIAIDAIVHVVSGLTDTYGTMVLSYLHKAIKAMNQLRTLEDALVIYRLARAPERRIWYIDVGNLPKMKAEQYVRDIMVKHKNRLIYDASTGQVRDDRKYMTMLDDYWLPRREGGRGTEVTTLPGGQTLGQMDDVLYFQKKLYQTLNVPVNRLNSDALFSLGRATEVTRDEIKFSRFITRIRARFANLFVKILEKQLVLKQVMTIEDFKLIEAKIKFDFAKDSYFTELKDAEVYQGRFSMIQMVDPMVGQTGMIGKYYSSTWARKNLLRQTEDDIEEQEKEMKEDGSEAQFEAAQEAMMNPEGDGAPGGGGGGGAASGGASKKKPSPPSSGDSGSAPPKKDDRRNKVRAAEIRYKQLKQKENKSIQDHAEMKKVSQIVAKNKGKV
ncbi:MAG: portal protein [Candidatus Paceibacteria bacterium]